ncbi:Y-family DNA polymerase [Herbaspirillum chlorophenolicum]|uniref:Y-family DNA polymerase n=1 Tax=Herbaspirillum chlorophenolicum TaxID=211589 RepID=UPI000773C959|nr:hypothetical protein [Herbaspirillum chlorophenolicum]
MAAPWFQMQNLAAQHGIVALSSNYTLYADMSNRVMEVLRQYSPRVEVYSIDESFLALDGLASLWPCMTAMGQSIRDRVDQWVGVPVCVGKCFVEIFRDSIGKSQDVAKGHVFILYNRNCAFW